METADGGSWDAGNVVTRPVLFSSCPYLAKMKELLDAIVLPKFSSIGKIEVKT